MKISSKKQSPVSDDFQRMASEHSVFWYVVAAFITGILLLGVNFFSVFGKGKSESEQEQYAFLNSGSASIETRDGDVFLAKSGQMIFDGDILSAPSGDVEFRFLDHAILRLKKGGSVRIQQLSPFPVFEPIAGFSWVTGYGETQIDLGNLRLFPEQSSLLISKEGKSVEVSSYAHPVYGEIWSDDPKNIAPILISSGQKIQFLTNALPDAIGDLRFSKLKKELRLQMADRDNKWAKENRIKDIALLMAYAEKNGGRKKFSLRENISGFFDGIFVFFPEIEKEALRAKENSLPSQYIFTHFFKGKGEQVAEYELSNKGLISALRIATLLRPNETSSPILIALEREAEKRNLSKAFVRLPILAFIEDSFQTNASLTASVLDGLVEYWKDQQKTPRNQKILNLHRHHISSLITKNISLVDRDILLSAGKLDDIARSWDEENASVIALEVVQKNIEFLPTFFAHRDYETIKMLIGKNRELLISTPPADLQRHHDDLIAKNYFAGQKLRLFRERGPISDDEVRATLAQESVMIRDLESFHAATDSTPKISKEDSLRNDFSDYGIIITSIQFGEGEKESAFVRGKLSDETIFTAHYELNSLSVSDFFVEAEKITIPSVRLSGISSALKIMREDSVPRDRIGDVLDPSILEKPEEKYSPVTIGLAKKTLQKNARDIGIEIKIGDIFMKNPREAFVAKATLSDLRNSTFSFDFDAESKEVKNIIIEKTSSVVTETTLPQLFDSVMLVLERDAKEKAFTDRIKWVMERSAITFDPDKVKIMGNSLRLSGEHKLGVVEIFADMEEEIFMTVDLNGESIGKNIPFLDLFALLNDRIEKKN